MKPKEEMRETQAQLWDRVWLHNPRTAPPCGSLSEGEPVGEVKGTGPAEPSLGRAGGKAPFVKQNTGTGGEFISFFSLCSFTLVFP